jgi:RNA polymerase sigma-70 factor (ECF subfamily)
MARRAFGEMMAAAAQRDEAALTDLYRTYNGGLVQFLWARYGDEAEDLAAETWIGVAQALPGFKGDERDFRRLLYTVARRRGIDHARKRTRRRTDPADVHEMALPAGGDVAEAVVDADASRRAVRQVAASLPPDQAEVLLLRVVAGLDVAEVAQIVGRRPAAVSVLQTRALRRLAERLGQAGFSERTIERPARS